MWLREPLPIEVSRVANVPIGGQFWDDVANAPMNVTGYSFSLKIAKNDGETPILTIPVTVTSAELGMIDFTINGSLLNIQYGLKEIVSLSYQIKATDAAGNSVIAARGPLTVTPGI
jgi:hypothetical protein